MLTEGGAVLGRGGERPTNSTPAVDRGKAALEAMFGRTPAQATPGAQRRGGRTAPLRRRAGVAGAARDSVPHVGAGRVPHWPRVCWSRSGSWRVAEQAGPSGTEVAAVGWGWAKPGGIPQARRSRPTTSTGWRAPPTSGSTSGRRTRRAWRNGSTSSAPAARNSSSRRTRRCERRRQGVALEKCRAWAKKLERTT